MNALIQIRLGDNAGGDVSGGCVRGVRHEQYRGRNHGHSHASGPFLPDALGRNVRSSARA